MWGMQLICIKWEHQRVSLEGGALEWNLNDIDLAKERCGGGIFWTEMKQVKNALKIVAFST